MTPPKFDDSDDKKRAFAAALCRFVGKPWDAAVHVFGATANPGVVLYVANTWTTDYLVVQEQQRLLSTGEVAKTLADKSAASRAVWEWTQNNDFALKDRIAAMQLYAELQEFVKKDAPPPMPQIPPIIQYVIDPDAGTPPNQAFGAAA